MTARTARPRTEVDAATVGALAEEFAAWRLGGCPGSGFAATFGAKVRKIARRHGQSHSELWAIVHRDAYKLIDAAS
jgi:hypothetical protein